MSAPGSAPPASATEHYAKAVLDEAVLQSKQIRIITANCASNSTNIAEFTSDNTTPKYRGIEAMVNDFNVSRYLTAKLASSEFLQEAYNDAFKKARQLWDKDKFYTMANVFGDKSPSKISAAHSEHMTLKRNRLNLLTLKQEDIDFKKIIDFVNPLGIYQSYPERFDASKKINPYVVADEEAYKEAGKEVNPYNIAMIRLWDECMSVAVAYKCLNEREAGFKQIRKWQGDMSSASTTLNIAVANKWPVDIVCAQEFYQAAKSIDHDQIDVAQNDVCLLSKVEKSTALGPRVKAIFQPMIDELQRSIKRLESNARRETDPKTVKKLEGLIKSAKSIKTSLGKTSAMLVPMGATKKNVLVLGCHWKAPDLMATQTILQEYQKAANTYAEKRWIAVGDFNFENKKLPGFMARGELKSMLFNIADVYFWTDPGNGMLRSTTSKCRTLASTQADKIGTKAQSAKDGFLTSPGLFMKGTVTCAVGDILTSQNMSDHMYMQLDAYCNF